jgi:hypothetical protein
MEASSCLVARSERDLCTMQTCSPAGAGVPHAAVSGVTYFWSYNVQYSLVQSRAAGRSALPVSHSTQISNYA